MSKTVEYTQATIATLANGTLDERFQVAMRDLIANVQDLNTNPKAKRTIKMTVEVRPSTDRDSAQVLIGVETKLAPMLPQETVLHFVRSPKTGKFEALASGYNQDHLFDTAAASRSLATSDKE